MSDADMKNEDGPAGTQEAMLDMHQTTAPEGGMIWDPVSKTYVVKGDERKPDRTQVPGTPTISDDYQFQPGNPQFEGVFAATHEAIDIHTLEGISGMATQQAVKYLVKKMQGEGKSPEEIKRQVDQFKQTTPEQGYYGYGGPGGVNKEWRPYVAPRPPDVMTGLWPTEQMRDNMDPQEYENYLHDIGYYDHVPQQENQRAAFTIESFLVESADPNSTARQWLDKAAWFDDQASRTDNPTMQRHYTKKAEYYRRLAEQYQAPDEAQQQAMNGAPDSSSATDVYQDRSDKPTINNTDNSFPSMISATTPEVTSTMLNTGKNSYEASEPANLADCPEKDCGGKMTDMDGDSVCHHCGHKEKIHYADKRAGLLDLAGPAAGLGMALDVVAPEVGVPLQAASLMGKIMGGGGGGGGGEQPGSETPSAGAGSSVANDDMQSTASSVEDGDWGTNGNENSGHDSEPDSGNKGSEAQDSAADELNSDVDTGTGGQDSVHGLDPHLIMEVFGPHLESIADNDDSHEDPIAKAIHEVFKKIDPDYLTKAARYEFNKIAGGKCPTCQIELDGATSCGIPNTAVPCPVGLTKGGGMGIQQTLPGSNAQSPSTMAQPMSHVLASDEDGFEVTSARRPKMCPAHDALVTYALTLGDPAAALQALSGELFGGNSCQGGYEMLNKNEQPTKCRYKPEMVKQEYWDEKDAIAEQRKLEREQQQALVAEQQQMMPPQPVEPVPAPQPEGQLIGGPEYDAQMEQQVQEEKQPVTQDIPSTTGLQSEQDYIPAEQGATTFPAEWNNQQQIAEIPVHAKIKWSGPPAAPVDSPEEMFTDTPPEEQIADDPAGLIHEGVLDTDGNPLKVGAKYEVRSPNNTDFIPDVYEITGEDSNLIQFRVNSNVEGGDPFSFDDSLSVEQIKAEGLSFVPASDDPNASGDVANTDDDATKGSDVPGQVSDLDTGGNSKASKTADFGGPTGGPYPESEYHYEDDPAPGTGLSQHGEPSRSDPREYEHVDLQALIDQLVNLAPEEKELLVQALQPGRAPDEETDEFGAPTAFDEGATEPYVGQDINEQRMAGKLEGKPEFDWLNEDNDTGVHTAGRDFSLGEQRSFVNESGSARNLDKLDLSGTHYPEGGIVDPFDDSALFM